MRVGGGGIAPRLMSTEQRLVEIHHRGGSERIERGAQVGHGGRKNGRDYQSRDASWQAAPDEHGIDGIGRLGRGQTGVRIMHEQKNANEEEQRELEKDDNPA